jgi:arylsulfatase A-like enzyme
MVVAGRSAAALLMPVMLVGLLGACETPEPPGRAGLRGAVVIVLDTLRADRLSVVGHPRPTTPALDALAARGVLFEQAVSHSSWTLPAMAGLLAGHYPTQRTFEHELKVSLVETLQAAGFATGAVTEGGYASRFFGMDRGFASFEEAQTAIHLVTEGEMLVPPGEAGIEQTFASARAWLEAHADGPFFLLVHTYEIHVPYRERRFVEGKDPGELGPTFEVEHREGLRHGRIRLSRAERAYLEGLYDGGVAVADREVGILLEALETLGISDETLVVVTSDHGEELGERSPRWAGWHGHTLYDELVRVPLLVLDPSRTYPLRWVPWQVRVIDVMPTVLDLLGVPAQAGGAGRSLLPLMRGEELAHRPALIRLFPREAGAATPKRMGVRSGQHKLLVNLPFLEPSASVTELYDLGGDPREERNLAEARTELGAELRAQLDRELAALREEGPPDFRPRSVVPSEERERLEALGYATP